MKKIITTVIGRTDVDDPIEAIASFTHWNTDIANKFVRALLCDTLNYDNTMSEDELEVWIDDIVEILMTHREYEDYESEIYLKASLNTIYEL